MCEELVCPNICILGDFNACSGKAFGKLLVTFSVENGFVISDKRLITSDTFTFVSDCHETTSWLDHCQFSNNFHNIISCIDVLKQCISSDQRPLFITVSLDNLPRLNENDSAKSILSKNTVKWSKASPEQKCEFSEESK